MDSTEPSVLIEIKNLVAELVDIKKKEATQSEEAKKKQRQKIRKKILLRLLLLLVLAIALFVVGYWIINLKID